jgi:hypothetical protein
MQHGVSVPVFNAIRYWGTRLTALNVICNSVGWNSVTRNIPLFFEIAIIGAMD